MFFATAEIGMKLAEFHIGLEFIEGPFWWRCTEVGSRAVVAIRLVEDDLVWYAGPPYMVEEVVVDEARLAGCHLTEEEHTEAALIDADTSGHPGYPHEAMQLMADNRLKSSVYPRRGMLWFDRLSALGKILHPYAARKVGEEWMISFYSPFTQNWGEMPEAQFVALPISTSVDIKRRAG
jgi:hypothetical protein